MNVVSNFLKNVTRLLKRNDGATGIEYGLIAAGIALVVLPAVTVVGSSLNTKFDDVSVALAGSSGDPAGCSMYDPCGADPAEFDLNPRFDGGPIFWLPPAEGTAEVEAE